jgi:hypothetical protein
METHAKNGAVMKIARHYVSNKIATNVLQLYLVADFENENFK